MAEMAGMDMSSHAMDMSGHAMSMALMPGMLTPKQMEVLKKADGEEFDHLFLTGMIQHHNGALIMVKDLFEMRARVRMRNCSISRPMSTVANALRLGLCKPC